MDAQRDSHIQELGHKLDWVISFTICVAIPGLYKFLRRKRCVTPKAAKRWERSSLARPTFGTHLSFFFNLWDQAMPRSGALRAVISWPGLITHKLIGTYKFRDAATIKWTVITLSFIGPQSLNECGKPRSGQSKIDSRIPFIFHYSQHHALM